MKRGTIFGIVCACLALALLAGVAILVTYESGDTLFNEEKSEVVRQADDVLEALQAPLSQPSATGAKSAGTMNAAKDTAENKEETTSKDAAVAETEAETRQEVADPSYIWVGDSRTIGMRDAMDNHDIYIGAAGEGYDWFVAEGLKPLEAALQKYPTLPVIFNFGVNDYCNMYSYLSLYKTIEQDHTTNKFYYLGIYPIDPEADLYTNNEEISDFNAHLKEAFPGRFMDSYTYLLANEVQTVDGIHYSEETYRDLYEYATTNIEKMKD